MFYCSRSQNNLKSNVWMSDDSIKHLRNKGLFLIVIFEGVLKPKLIIDNILLNK